MLFGVCLILVHLNKHAFIRTRLLFIDNFYVSGQIFRFSINHSFFSLGKNVNDALVNQTHDQRESELEGLTAMALILIRVDMRSQDYSSPSRIESIES